MDTGAFQRTFRGIPVTQGSLVDMILEMRDGCLAFFVTALVGFALFLATITGLVFLVVIFIMAVFLIEKITVKNRQNTDSALLDRWETGSEFQKTS